MQNACVEEATPLYDSKNLFNTLGTCYIFDCYSVPSSSKYVINNIIPLFFFLGGTVASWLVRSTPERAVQVRALAGDIVLCS